MRNPPKASVVILNWNAKNILKECVASVKAMTYPIHELIVVDNYSSDGSAGMVKAEFPEVTLVENDQNYGAIEGKNIGLRKAMESPIDYIFVIDNDLVADGKALAELVDVCEKDARIGIVGAKIYDFDRPDIILSCGSKIDYTQNIIRPYGHGEKEEGQYNGMMEVDHVGAGHMLVRREVFEKVGLLDSSFIGYGCEDVDFCVRVKKANYKIVFCPSAKVWHRPHSGVGHYTYRKKYLEARNAVCFMKKHAKFSQWLKYLFFVIFGLPYAFIREGLRGNIRGVVGKAMGLYDGFRGVDDVALRIMTQKEL
jgi:GT2 family glycosyltransferase